MEIVDRPPQSWTDKGMNWAAPDPLCADYIAAIVGAINERRGLFVNQLGYNRFTDVVNVTRCQPLSADDIRNLNNWAVKLIPDFVNIERHAEQIGPASLWTAEEIMRDPDCRILEFDGPGCTRDTVGQWMKAMRNLLNKLTMTRMYECYVQRFGRYVDFVAGDSFSDTVQQAMDDAMSIEFEWGGDTYKEIPLDLAAYCASSDYRMGWNRYRTWITTSCYRLVSRQQAPYRPCNFIVDYITTRNIELRYADVLQEAVYDDAGSGLPEGESRQVIPYRPGQGYLLTIGDPMTVPENLIKPVTEYDENQNAVGGRQGTVTGYSGKAYITVDHTAEGGLKFC